MVVSGQTTIHINFSLISAEIYMIISPEMYLICEIKKKQKQQREKKIVHRKL